MVEQTKIIFEEIKASLQVYSAIQLIWSVANTMYKNLKLRQDLNRLEAPTTEMMSLPSPEILKAYNIVESGLAGRIISLVEKQAEHRIELERAVVLGSRRRSWAGLVLGFVIVCLFLTSSTYLILNGHELAGGILGGSGLVSLVSAFIYGTNARAKERAEKRKALFGEDSDED